MHATVLIVLLGLGGTDVWTASPLERVYPDSVRERGDKARMHLYAARDEQESFQICIRSRSDTPQAVDIEAEPIRGGIPAPELRRAGYVLLRNHDGEGLFPDPLFEFAPFQLAPGETCAVWVTYAVPKDARPGTYGTRLAVRVDGKVARKIKVRLDVFGFGLPGVPALRSMFGLDRMAICTRYGIEPGALSGWKPIYDALSRHRLSYSVWDPASLVPIPRGRGPETETLKEHLAHAVTAGRMNTIDLGVSGGEGIAPFPEAAAGKRPDALEVYLNDMGNWLEERGWLERACIQPAAMGARPDWDHVRRACERTGQLDNRIPRLLAGNLHPAFDGCAEIWAIPLVNYSPDAQVRLREGLPLAAAPPYPARHITASSTAGVSAALAWGSAPEDGYDGCMLTAWRSERAPSKANPEWFEVAFAEPVRTRLLRIGWPFGIEAAVVRVATSYDGKRFSTATAEWDHHFSIHQPIPSWSEGRFRTEKTFRAVRIEFLGTSGNVPAGIAEIEFEQPRPLEAAQRARPVHLWLGAQAEAFPSLRIGAAPSEPRLLAWTCWGHGLEGFTGGALNQWPESWIEPSPGQHPAWVVEGDGTGFLFYPGQGGPVPSIRVETLRDGIEDFEYLALFENAVRTGRVRDEKAVTLSHWGPVPLSPGAGEIGALGRQVRETRVRIGRELARAARHNPR